MQDLFLLNRNLDYHNFTTIRMHELTQVTDRPHMVLSTKLKGIILIIGPGIGTSRNYGYMGVVPRPALTVERILKDTKHTRMVQIRHQ